MQIIPNRPAGSPDYAILRHTKIHHITELTDVQRHNNREMHVPNADPHGPGPQVVWGDGAIRQAVQDRLKALGIRVRKGAVIALELMLSTSREFWEKMTPEQRDRMIKRWVRRNLAYVRARFGRDAIIGAVLHGDETTIHLHVIVVPVRLKVDGRRRDAAPRWTLTARDLVGGKGDMRHEQTVYAKAMKRFNLARGKEGSKTRNIPNKEYEALLSQALEETRALEIELRKGIAAVEERESECDDRMAALAASEDAHQRRVAEAEADLNRRADELAAREAQAAIASAEREAFDARAAALGEREAELQKARKKAIRWQHSAIKRQKEIEANEQRIATTQAALAKREDELAKSMDALVRLRRGWMIVEENLDRLWRAGSHEVRDAMRSLREIGAQVNKEQKTVPGFDAALQEAQRRAIRQNGYY